MYEKRFVVLSLNRTIMKTKQLSRLLFITLLMSILTGCVTSLDSATNRSPVIVQYENPQWAPSYHSGVRYYYFPDLELYYDLSNRDYIFLNNGQWFFSRNLPPMYADYDLYNGFVISLNVKVYQPWRHHQFYVSNYPRYYYRNYYKNEHQWVRGFGENDRRPIYHGGDGRRHDDNDKGRTVNPRNEQDGNRTFNANPTGRRTDQNENGRATETPRTSRYDNATPETPRTQGRNENATQPTKEPEGRSSSYSRDPQETNYYGKRIGKPVTVDRQMRETKADKQTGRSSGGKR
jgi:hypothetical protein